jgi:hypothetical protein
MILPAYNKHPNITRWIWLRVCASIFLGKSVSIWLTLGRRRPNGYIAAAGSGPHSLIIMLSYLEICAVSLRACTDLMTIMFVCILIFLAKFSNCLDNFSFLVKLSSLLACHAILGRRHALKNMMCKVWCHLLPLLGGNKKSLFDKTVASLFTIFLLVSHVNI